MRPNRILFFMAILLPLLAKAQLNNEFFYDLYTVEKEDSGRLLLGLEAFGYFSNNELRQEIIPGYTLFGYQFRPSIAYVASSNIRLEGGGYLVKEFGDAGFSEIRPTLTIAYKKDGFSMIFGTLEGALSHQLIEPLYDFENIIDRRIEDGMQFKLIRDKISFDAWIEWINMIGFGDPEQEEFNTGISGSVHLFSMDRFRIELPLQLYINHRGGQIDTSDLPAGSILNSAAGISLVMPVRMDGILRSVRTDNYMISYEATESIQDQPELSGSGYYLNVTSTFKWFDLMFSYWNGHDFYSPFGGPLYQSVSYNYTESGNYSEQRELIIGRLLFEHDFKNGLALSFRFQPVYDLGNGLFEHMESLYLRYRTDFVLNRKKRD